MDFNKENQKLIDDEILDSFDIISIVGELNEAFDVDISVDELLPENCFGSIHCLYFYYFLSIFWCQERVLLDSIIGRQLYINSGEENYLVQPDSGADVQIVTVDGTTGKIVHSAKYVYDINSGFAKAVLGE